WSASGGDEMPHLTRFSAADRAHTTQRRLQFFCCRCTVCAAGVAMLGLRRALAGLVAAAAPLTVILPPGLADRAAATTPDVGFTADPLPTYQTNGIAWALAEANGVVYVGGTFSAVRPPGAAAGTSETPAD